MSDSNFTDESLRLPIPIDISGTVVDGGSSGTVPPPTVLFSSINFFRTESNANITITAPSGDEVVPSTIWMSPAVFLPTNAFNSVLVAPEISVSNPSITILTGLTLEHTIAIHCKLTQTDGTNYANQREIRCTLVNASNAVYNLPMRASQQPDTGQHAQLLFSGYVAHLTGDVVKIQFNVVQDADESDTLLTVFSVSWNIFNVR